MSSLTFFLTPNQSKSIIAKGIQSYPPFESAKRDGKIIICYGTTNSFIAKEVLLDNDFEQHHYVTGHTISERKGEENKLNNKEKAIVIEKGKVVRVENLSDEFKNLSPGDVVLKGANAIDSKGHAGILIGHPTGGTFGAMVGPIIAKKAFLIHPVGIEKTVPVSIEEAASLTPGLLGHSGPVLALSPGEIFTECDALHQIFSKMTFYPYAAGGVGGAEGAVWIIAAGENKEMKKLTKFLSQIQTLPPFVES